MKTNLFNFRGFMIIHSIFDHEKEMKRLPFFGRLIFLFIFILIFNEINGFFTILFGIIAIAGLNSLIEQRLRNLKWNTKHTIGWTILSLIPVINIIPLAILIFHK